MVPGQFSMRILIANILRQSASVIGDSLFLGLENLSFFKQRN